MKISRLKFKALFLLLLISLLCFQANAIEPIKHQITFSFTLSGHIFVGVGYNYFFNEHHAISTTIHMIPYKFTETMFAANAGYNYYLGNKSWHPNIGGEFMILFGPADKESKIGLVLFNIVPGIQYEINDYHNINGRLWVANFLSEEYEILPIGIEFKYGYNLHELK